MEFTGAPVLKAPQQSRVDIGFQTDVFSDVAFFMAAVVRYGVDIRVADSIQKIVPHKSEGINPGSLPFFFRGENPGAFQKETEKLSCFCGMGNGTGIFSGRDGGEHIVKKDVRSLQAETVNGVLFLNGLF